MSARTFFTLWCRVEPCLAERSVVAATAVVEEGEAVAEEAATAVAEEEAAVAAAFR
jgi:hypothetical protein